MEDVARHRLTLDEFYEWVAGREGKYELIDGEPVMMAGANRRHDRIAGNAIRLVGNHLQGHRCQPFTSDTYIGIPAGNRRQADMGIDCGPFEDASLVSVRRLWEPYEPVRAAGLSRLGWL